jgi:hypothetical protein
MQARCRIVKGFNFAMPSFRQSRLRIETPVAGVAQAGDDELAGI